MTKKSEISILATRGWVSLNQFAKIIGVSYPTALNMRDEGQMRYVLVGGTYRIYADEVKRFLQNGNFMEENTLKILEKDT